MATVITVVVFVGLFIFTFGVLGPEEEEEIEVAEAAEVEEEEN